ncbi:hypothetical protein BGK67_00350 [Streptomyces subrutilus]|uniref:Uncharacterized protein n=1 Tax=Streptomyces subrutilus TaxID=36818 RepID=A0A1E5PL16_9ACTN|nr:hypothetical protein BGK67_00350 [Streptomyces subrutilus]
MAEAGQCEVLGELACRVGAQWDGAADGVEAAGRVMAAEDEELGACEGAGDGADDRFGGVTGLILVQARDPGR